MAEELRKLENVIKIGDHNYAVNAVEAETAQSAAVANKVANKLTIKAFVNNAETSLVYDGNAAINIDKVAAAKNADTASNATNAAVAVSANSASRVVGKLTVKKEGASDIVFDGSADKEIVLDAALATENANKIQVAMTDGPKYATITAKPSDPSGGNIGDIWFKY